jgi:hypothetical protein
MRKRKMRAFDKKYWERLVKRQITEDEFGAASGAALQADNAGLYQRAKKRLGLKAIRRVRQEQLKQKARP